MDEVNVLRSKYAREIEDGRRIEAFTSLGEWQWYVEKVINPTIQEYTERILEGKATTDREDWMLRGMVNGLKMIVDSTNAFVAAKQVAAEKARDLEKRVKEDE